MIRDPTLDRANLIPIQHPRIARLYAGCIYQHPQILVCLSDHISTVARDHKTVFPGALLQGVSTSNHGKQLREALEA